MSLIFFVPLAAASLRDSTRSPNCWEFRGLARLEATLAADGDKTELFVTGLLTDWERLLKASVVVADI